jgi:DNA-binding NarL/FixJ family response regulator
MARRTERKGGCSPEPKVALSDIDAESDLRITLGGAYDALGKRDSAMGDGGTSSPNGGLGTQTQFLETGRLLDKVEATIVDSFIAVIEGRTFLRECMFRSMQPAFSLPLLTYSTVSELESQLGHASAELVILSLIEVSNEASVRPLKALAELVHGIPIIVLASANHAELARTAVRHGAKGYIPLSMGFEIAIEAARFVLAGGDLCVDGLLTRRSVWPELFGCSQPLGLVTARELPVIRAIQQGKSNKIIAYELNMCESTVKVHVRNVMKKLKAKNRTEAATKARVDTLEASPRPAVRF